MDFEIVNNHVCSRCLDESRDEAATKAVENGATNDYDKLFKLHYKKPTEQTCIALSVDYETVYLCKKHLNQAIAMIDGLELL